MPKPRRESPTSFRAATPRRFSVTIVIRVRMHTALSRHTRSQLNPSVSQLATRIQSLATWICLGFCDLLIPDSLP